VASKAARRVFLSMLVAGAVAFVAGAEPTQPAEPEKTAQAWDQAQVAELGAGLATAVDAIQRSYRGELASGMPSGDRRSRYDTTQNLRRLSSEARQLSRQLAGGAGHDETIGIFLQLQELAHETADSAKRTMITEPTLDRIADARAILTQLAPYYGETWTPAVNVRGLANPN
jgi:ferric-dicitrate binding protein FerR (iron transport regulator)